jgi:hypothetical protein
VQAHQPDLARAGQEQVVPPPRGLVDVVRLVAPAGEEPGADHRLFADEHGHGHRREAVRLAMKSIA